jgi:hypothetical protein
MEVLTLSFGLPVWEEEDLPIHLHGLPFRRKESTGLHPQQSETEDHQDITRKLPRNGVEEMSLRTEQEIVCEKNSNTIDEEAQGDNLQEESGSSGILRQGGKIMV